MKKLLLLSILASTFVWAEPVHSSISAYYESRDYTSSKQKDDAQLYGVGVDIHHKGSEYKVTYESNRANTKNPPLDRDLKNQKLFLRYAYALNDSFEININYLDILHDNIALTNNGSIYGAGLTYHFNKKISANFTEYYSNYDDFNLYQSDLKVDFKMKLNDIKIKLSSITKYINIDEKNQNSFTKNAKNDYLTTGIKLISHYKSYHLGGGIYFGKRVFAIMNDGFKVQHHAMEIDRTYAACVGKDISKFVFRFQYIYQRAKELPMQNDNVEIKTMRFIANYRF